MKSRVILKSGVAIAALLVTGSLAAAQTTDITQESYNYGSINNDLTNSYYPLSNGEYFSGGGLGVSGGFTWNRNDLNLGTGASVSIGATGGVTAVSSTAINTTMPGPSGHFGEINQRSENSGTISNFGGSANGVNWYSGGATPFDIDLASGSLAIGASATISATGAVAAFSVNGIDDGTGSSPLSISTRNVGGIYQWGDATGFDVDGYATNPTAGVNNTGAVYNYGRIIDVGAMSPGASASISATGAVASVSSSGIGAFYAGSGGGSPTFSPGSTGPIGQWVNNNTSEINNDGDISVVNSVTTGTGSSISISATGAVAAISSSYIDANVSGSSFGYTWQGAINNGYVENYGTVNLSTTDLGVGSSVSISATGAVASFSFSAVAGDNETSVAFPSFGSSNPRVYEGETYNRSATHYASNGGNLYNVGTINNLGSLGTGASASVSATGAVSSIAFSANGVVLTGAPDLYDFYQSGYDIESGGVYNSGNVQNYGTIRHNNSSFALGTAASISISATGAVASLSVSSINSGSPGMYINDGYQYVENSGSIYNDATIGYNNTAGIAVGRGASISTSATGAVASVSLSAVNDSTLNFSFGRAYGDIYQDAYNYGSVENTVSNDYWLNNIGVGGSVSNSATGAVASVSISANNAWVTTGSLGSVHADVENAASVRNYGGTINFNSDTNLGTGASVSISATGAVSSISLSAIDSQVDYASASYSSQNVRNENAGDIYNSGFISGDYTSLGRGASLSISATGAVASRSVSINGTHWGSSSTVPSYTGTAYQYVRSSGTVENFGYITGVYNVGTGASVSISATGAVSSVSIAGIETPLVLENVGAISQWSFNSANVTNGNSETRITGEYGMSVNDGASIAISATGAVASWSVSAVQTDLANFDGVWTRGNVTQSVENSANVSNRGYIDIYAVDGATGVGSSFSVSATGAVASASVSAIGTYGSNIISFGSLGNVYQGTEYGNGIRNTGSISNYSNAPIKVTGGYGGCSSYLGVGSSVSMSATGAVAAVSFSSIQNSLAAPQSGLVVQNVYNLGDILNDSLTYNSGGSSIVTGNLATGASVSASATGAVASVGVNLIQTTSYGSGASFGNITQTVYNSGSVDNFHNTISGLWVGNLDTGASVSIGATGAVASVSFSSLSDNGLAANPQFGTITQTVTNTYDSGGGSGIVTNRGIIIVNGDLAKGASASISATGAVASISISNVNDGVATPLVATLTGSVSQSATNYSNVFNSGSIALNNGGGNASLGAGASLSVSASGAVSSVSFRSVR